MTAEQLYALFASVVALHLIALAGWTGTLRLMRKEVLNPEDAAGGNARHVEQEHPDVARAKRAHLNLLENAVPFFVVGYLYAGSGTSPRSALIYFATFTVARILHTVFYLWGRQPFRTISFGVGVLAIVGMAVQVIRTTLGA